VHRPKIQILENLKDRSIPETSDKKSSYVKIEKRPDRDGFPVVYQASAWVLYTPAAWSSRDIMLVSLCTALVGCSSLEDRPMIIRVRVTAVSR